jgi:hypothetical protein
MTHGAVGMCAPAVGEPVQVLASVEALYSMHTGEIRVWHMYTRISSYRAWKYNKKRGLMLNKALQEKMWDEYFAWGRTKYEPAVPSGWEVVEAADWESARLKQIRFLHKLHEEQGKTCESKGLK